MADQDPALEVLKKPEPIVMPGKEPVISEGGVGSQPGGDRGTDTFIPRPGQQDTFVPMPGQQGVTPPLKPGMNIAPRPNMGRDATIDFLRPFVGNIGGAIGTAVGTPAGPPGAFVGDWQGYVPFDMMMQYLKSQQPKSVGEALQEAEKEALINAVGGRLINGVYKGAQAFRNAGVPELYKLFPVSSQALEHNGFGILADMAKDFEVNLAGKSRAAAQARSGGEAFNKALTISNMMNGKSVLENANPQQLFDNITDKLRQGITPQASKTQFQTPLHYVSQDWMDALTNGTDPFQALRDKLATKADLEEALKIGQQYGKPSLNVRGDLQAFHMMDTLNQATTDILGPNMRRLDPKKLNVLWQDPAKQDMLKTLYGSQMKGDLDELMANIIKTQDSADPSKIFRFIKGGVLLGGGLPLALGHGVPAGAAAGIYIPTAMFSRALTKPGFARALTGFMQGSLRDTSRSTAIRAIMSGLQGVPLALMDIQGNKNYGQINVDNQGSSHWIDSLGNR